MDISDTLEVKSDQLNAEDLLAGPITVTIVGVKKSSDEQPVALSLDGGFKTPQGDWKVWRPCKSMRRLMVMAWPDCVKPHPNGPPNKPTIDAEVWIGRSVKLVRDPTVKWGKDLVGGIRIAAMSHIASKYEVALAESKGKKKLVTVEKLDVAGQQKTQQPTAPQHELTEPFKAMKLLWKKRREVARQPVTAADFTAFVVHVTEALIPAAKVMAPASYTIEVIQKCVDSIDFEMPEQV